MGHQEACTPVKEQPSIKVILLFDVFNLFLNLPAAVGHQEACTPVSASGAMKQEALVKMRPAGIQKGLGPRAWVLGFRARAQYKSHEYRGRSEGVCVREV